MVIKKFKILVERLQSTSSRIEKESILSEYKDDTEIKEILYFIYNPYIVTGISSKKINRKLSLTKSYPPCNLSFILDYISKNNHGRDEDIAFLLEYITYYKEYEDLLKQIFTKSLKLGVQPTTLNKVFGKGFIPQFGVMLACKYFDDPEKLLPQDTSFILTEKLDGVRCILVNENSGPKFYSRQGQLITGLVELEEEAKQLPRNFVFDGELLLDLKGLDSKELYRETMKVIGADKEKRGVIFNCFDWLTIEQFEKGYAHETCDFRKSTLHDLLERKSLPHFKNVDMLYIGKDQSQIQYWLDKIISEGGEGIMINVADAPYEAKRSNFLLKCKKFQTADVLVIALHEGTGQNTGKLGAIEVKFLGPDGKEYTNMVGSGLTQEQRELYWKSPEMLLNQIIEIGYFEITKNQQGTYGLRFPTFKWLRSDKTTISMH